MNKTTHHTPYTKHTKLSVVLATRNEESNIAECLKSVKGLADEIIIFDESSTDDTKSIAKSFGAIVFDTSHEAIFHITKQKAIDKAKGKWVLQLDADERVSEELAREVLEVIDMTDDEILSRRPTDSRKWKLFERHTRIIRQRDGNIGKSTGSVAAFFIPRINYFIGKPLIHAGVYPDASIRLIRKGKARLPGKSVHEVMEVDGEVAWLFNDLEHHESPTFRRYIARANRYTDLTANELAEKKVSKNSWQLFNYSVIKPKMTFLKLFFRHRGYKDGIRGFLWSVLSAFHFPLAYWKYWFKTCRFR